MTVLLLLVFLGAWGGVDRPARADHTGVMQLNDRVGPYVVRAFSEPDPPRTDRCRITVIALQPGGLRPVPTAVVSVSAEQAGGRAAKVSMAADRTRDPQQVFHAADLELPAAGRWTVTVRVSGPEGAGSAAFPLDVEAAPWRAGPVILAAAGAVLALGLAAVWLLRRSRRRRG
jgi:hypothetical protein